MSIEIATAETYNWDDYLNFDLADSGSEDCASAPAFHSELLPVLSDDSLDETTFPLPSFMDDQRFVLSPVVRSDLSPNPGGPRSDWSTCTSDWDEESLFSSPASTSSSLPRSSLSPPPPPDASLPAYYLADSISSFLTDPPLGEDSSAVSVSPALRSPLLEIPLPNCVSSNLPGTTVFPDGEPCNRDSDLRVQVHRRAETNFWVNTLTPKRRRGPCHRPGRRPNTRAVDRDNSHDDRGDHDTRNDADYQPTPPIKRTCRLRSSAAARKKAQCLECEKNFTRSADMQRHLKTVHRAVLTDEEILGDESKYRIWCLGCKTIKSRTDSRMRHETTCKAFAELSRSQ